VDNSNTGSLNESTSNNSQDIPVLFSDCMTMRLIKTLKRQQMIKTLFLSIYRFFIIPQMMIADIKQNTPNIAQKSMCLKISANIKAMIPSGNNQAYRVNKACTCLSFFCRMNLALFFAKALLGGWDMCHYSA
jgi:hypothetical protein